MEKVCNGCVDRKPKVILYAAYECAMANAERNFKRLWTLIIILTLLLVGTNIAWIAYESQVEIAEETIIMQENESGYNSYIGSAGDIIYGEANDN